MFIGRKKELQELKDFYQREAFSLAFIYGRRRIGKSRLIQESLIQNPDIPSVYYQCQKTSEKQNILSFLQSIKMALGIQLGVFDSFTDTLKALIHAFREKTLIIAIDEYPYLKKSVKGIDSMIQALDEELRSEPDCKTKLILCGSYVSSMKDSIGESNGPLRGRSSLTLNLKALNYQEASAFLPKLSLEEKIMAYSVFGGVPYYLVSYNQKKSVTGNIKSLILEDNGLLHHENELVLEELSDSSSSNIVLELIASGIHDFSRLNQKSGLNSSASLSWVLNRLQEMSLVCKKTDLNSKDSKYFLQDQFLSFYYRYVFTNTSALQLMSPDTYYQELIEEDFFKEYLPHSFEQICSEYLTILSRQGKETFLELGRYTYNSKTANAEFDIVGKSKKGYVFFECKYQKNPLDSDTISHLKQKLDDCGLSYCNLGFFSKSGFTPEAEKEIKENHYQSVNINDLFSF